MIAALPRESITQLPRGLLTLGTRKVETPSPPGDSNPQPLHYK